MSFKHFLRVTVAASLTAIAAMPAHADPVSFGQDPNANASVPPGGGSVTAREQFMAKLASWQIETFESALVGKPLTLSVFEDAATLTQTQSPTPLYDGQITNETRAGRFNTTGPEADGASVPGQWWETARKFEITLTAGTYANAFGFFGTDFGDFDGKLTIDLFDDVTGASDSKAIQLDYEEDNPSASLLFWGYANAGLRFNRLVFSVGQTTTIPDDFDFIGFDQMVLGKVDTPGTIPEPTSLALVGLALLGLGATARRKQRA